MLRMWQEWQKNVTYVEGNTYHIHRIGTTYVAYLLGMLRMWQEWQKNATYVVGMVGMLRMWQEWQRNFTYVVPKCYVCGSYAVGMLRMWQKNATYVVGMVGMLGMREACWVCCWHGGYARYSLNGPNAHALGRCLLNRPRKPVFGSFITPLLINIY